MDRLGLDEDELCAALGADPLSIVSGAVDDAPALAILLTLTGEATERIGAPALRRWLRARGPTGRPLEHLVSRDYRAFEDDLEQLADRGFVLRGGSAGGGAGPAPPPNVGPVTP